MTTLKSIQAVESADLGSGTFIVLLHADKIPPHLGLIVDGKYYTWRASDVILGQDVNVLIQTVKRKQIPTLFVQLGATVLHQTSPDQIFSMSEGLVAGNTTCLTPIKSYLSELMAYDYAESRFIFELLSTLQNQGKISNAYHANMAQFLIEDAYTLLEYSWAEIEARIGQLQKELEKC